MNSRRWVFFGFAVVVLISVTYFLFRENSDITNYPPKNQNIVAFGDSLVEGIGSTHGNDFVSMVGRTLGVEIVNKGRSGDTTASALFRIDEILAEDPSVVMVLLGGNDVLRRVPKKETFTNLGTIIARLQAQGVVVVLLGIRGGILSDGYEGDFEALAKKYHTAYVANVLEGIITNPQYMYDGIHPNDQGYAIVAGRVVEVLKKVMR